MATTHPPAVTRVAVTSATPSTTSGDDDLEPQATSGREPVLVCVRGCRRPRRHIQLGEDIAQVSLDRLLTQYQHSRNVRVASPFGNQPEHLDFTFGKTTGPCSSQKPVDILRGRRSTNLSKGTARYRKFCCCRILITELAQCPRQPGPWPEPPRTASRYRSTVRSIRGQAERIVNLAAGQPDAGSRVRSHCLDCGVAEQCEQSRRAPRRTGELRPEVPAATMTSTPAGSIQDRRTGPCASASRRRIAETAAAVRPRASQDNASPGCGSRPSSAACW